MTPALGQPTVVDLYFDPVCPYAWIVSRWLAVVAVHRPLQVRHHLMSLAILNEGARQSAAYLANVERTTGPSRVFAAAAVHIGEGILSDLYTAFGTPWFARWRLPDPDDLTTALQTALTAVRLPAGFAQAAHTSAYDAALRESHSRGVADLGPHAGTPILHINDVPWFGPVLNAVPEQQAALDLYDSLLVLTRHPDFCELKRPRTQLPRLE